MVDARRTDPAASGAGLEAEPAKASPTVCLICTHRCMKAFAVPAVESSGRRLHGNCSGAELLFEFGSIFDGLGDPVVASP